MLFGGGSAAGWGSRWVPTRRIRSVPGVPMGQGPSGQIGRSLIPLARGGMRGTYAGIRTGAARRGHSSTQADIPARMPSYRYADTGGPIALEPFRWVPQAQGSWV